MSTAYKVCIVQLTRIGDLLQTKIAADALKAENQSAKLTLICREKFAKNIVFLLQETFDEIIYLDTKSFFSHDHDHLASVKERLKTFVKKCNSTEYDFLFNLTFNKSSSYLATLIKAKHKFGLNRNDQNQIVIKDQASQLIYSSVLASNLTPFNLVDLFRQVMGVKNLPSFIKNDQKKKKNIVIHPFASHERKKLSMQKWSEIIYQTLKKNPSHEVFIVGGPEDVFSSKKLLETPIIKAYSERIHNLVGKASIKEVFTLLQDAGMFIGHDSMVSHLTSFHQTPSLVISLGTVRPMETTPYNEEAYVLNSKVKCFPCHPTTACDIYSCHNDIHPSIAAGVATAILNKDVIDEKYIAKNFNIFQLNQCQLSKTFVNGDLGLLLASITDHNQSLDEVFRVFYGVLWSFFFFEKDYPATVPKVSTQTAESLVHYQKGIEQLYDLYSHGAAFAKRIIDDAKEPKINISIIQDSVKKISSLDQLLVLLKGQYKLLSPLIDFINTMKLNSEGETIIQVAEGNLLSFHDGKVLLSVLQELLQKALENSGPVRLQGKYKEV